MRLCAAGVVALGLLGAPLLGTTFISIGPPGTTSSYGSGITNGIIAGFSGSHSFLFDGSTYTLLDDPLATNGTFARGAGDGAVVGEYDNAAGSHGFRYKDGAFTTYDAPGAGATLVYGAYGQKVVGYTDTNSVWRAFVFDGTNYTYLDHPDSTQSDATAIDATRIIGSYFPTSGGINGFIYDGTSFSDLNFPGASITYPAAMDGPWIVGVYYSGTQSPLFAHGFLYDGSNWITVDHPLGVDGTFVQGIEGNTLVGTYFDNQDHQHAFLAVVPEPSSLWLLGGALALWRGSRSGRRARG